MVCIQSSAIRTTLAEEEVNDVQTRTISLTLDVNSTQLNSVAGTGEGQWGQLAPQLRSFENVAPNF